MSNISTAHEAKIILVFSKALVVAEIRGRSGDFLSNRAILELSPRLLVCLDRSLANDKGISADLRSLLVLLRVHIKQGL